MTLDMKDFARRGAQVRITELQSELEAIYGAFPDLRRGRGRKLVVNQEERARERVVGIRRGRARRKMSAAQRKAVGERMRKYWAARRAEAAAQKR